MGEILDIKRGEAGLFGYGSLLLQRSMEQTLGRPYTRKRYACKLHGWSRRWNALYPNNRYYFSTGGDERLYPASIAYLNICRADVSVNGVLYVITEQELSAFDRREWIYDRVDVTRDLSECQVEGGVVWAYVAKPDYTMNSIWPVEEAAIRASYIRIVEEGLDELGQAFRDGYASSTEQPRTENIISDQQD
jgi:cation transport regulator ChaC